MIVKKAIISAYSIEERTNRNKEQASILIERVDKFNSNKSGINAECKSCSYLFPDRIGGSAITSTVCGICEKPMMFGNSCTDVLCKQCAESNLLCKHCGGDIDMKNRRNPRLFQQRHGAKGE